MANVFIFILSLALYLEIKQLHFHSTTKNQRAESLDEYLMKL
jgi:hypothetical protein